LLNVFGRPLGFRPARKGLPLKMAGRGQASGAKSPCSGRKAAKSPEARTKAKRSPRRNVERRCRVPLFPGDPGSKPRLLTQGAPFGVPPPSFLLEGGSLNPPFTRRDLRAAMPLGRRKSAVNTQITGLTIMIAVVISTPPGTSGLLAFGRDRQMTGSKRSSGGLDDRRKRLLFRCWHRGTREMDLILGRFADAAIADLTDIELGQLERLIELPDPDLYAALSSNALLAPEYRTGLFDRIRSFPADHDA
jgi:antitoxin CptB